MFYDFSAQDARTDHMAQNAGHEDSFSHYLKRFRHAQSRYEAAERQNRVEMHKERLAGGTLSLKALTLISNLALLLEIRGEVKEATQLYAEVLEHQEHLLGVRHPHTLETAGNLAEVLLTQARYAEAARITWRMIKSCYKCHGQYHSNTLTNVGRFGRILQLWSKSRQDTEFVRNIAKTTTILKDLGLLEHESTHPKSFRDSLHEHRNLPRPVTPHRGNGAKQSRYSWSSRSGNFADSGNEITTLPTDNTSIKSGCIAARNRNSEVERDISPRRSSINLPRQSFSNETPIYPSRALHAQERNSRQTLISLEVLTNEQLTATDSRDDEVYQEANVLNRHRLRGSQSIRTLNKSLVSIPETATETSTIRKARSKKRRLVRSVVYFWARLRAGKVRFTLHPGLNRVIERSVYFELRNANLPTKRDSKAWSSNLLTKERPTPASAAIHKAERSEMPPRGGKDNDEGQTQPVPASNLQTKPHITSRQTNTHGTTPKPLPRTQHSFSMPCGAGRQCDRCGRHRLKTSEHMIQIGT